MAEIGYRGTHYNAWYNYNFSNITELKYAFSVIKKLKIAYEENPVNLFAWSMQKHRGEPLLFYLKKNAGESVACTLCDGPLIPDSLPPCN